MPDFLIEKELTKAGWTTIAGIDEAGRGPLAGPVVAAAVVLPQDEKLFSEINDSKKLTHDKRIRLFDLVIEKSIAYSIKMIDNDIIDEINILQATIAAMRTASESMNIIPDYLIIDGNRFHQNEIILPSKNPQTINKSTIPFQTIIGGDSISTSISAASILAKVYRDSWMTNVADAKYPVYNFRKHKGYGTAEHIKLIRENGICEYHRKSFLKKIIVG